MTREVTNLENNSVEGGEASMGDVKELRSGSGVEREAWAPLKFRHKWVPTRNVRNFQVMMEIMERGAGEGRFGAVLGQAGRGKTRTVRNYAANNGCVYILALDIWKNSELGMLQALCRELGMERAPHRKNECFLEAADRLVKSSKPVFFDEMDLLPQRIELVRQLTEVTGAPFVLVGEPRLADHLTRNQRTWSRTFQVLQFEPVSLADIMFYARETAGLQVGEDAARAMSEAPGGGDWRVIKRTVIDLVEIANHHQTEVISPAMVKQAVRVGIKGKVG